MKKVALICLALILALGSLGVSYALWSDNLYINGTIETGTLCWEWTSTNNLDPGPPNHILDYHCNPGFEGDIYWQGTKDVGYTTTTIKDAKTIEMTLTNVYPCYFNSISVYGRNCGTIPLHFEWVSFDSDYEDPIIIDWIDTDYAPISLDLDGDGNDDIEIKWGNHIGSQVHPGKSTGEISFWIHVMQAAPQNETMHFTITFNAVQYNESIHP